jgi:hypothetical protein
MSRFSTGTTAWIALLRLALVLLALTSLGGASKVHARLTTSAVSTQDGAPASTQTDEGDEDDSGDEDDGDEDDSGE